MNRRDLQELAELRCREAQILLDARCWEGAYYLSGYAIECALKACIAKRIQRHEFPDRDLATRSYTHHLGQLLHVARLDGALKAELTTNPTLAAYWEVAKVWSEQRRYERSGEAEAKALYEAITDERDGVLRWIRQSW